MATRKIIWRVVSGASIAVGLLAAIAGVISGRPATVVAGVGLAAFGLFSYQFSARL